MEGAADDDKRVLTFFNAYKKVQEISIKLRNLLSNLNVEQYQNISYALYYEGHRYSLETLKPEWLRVSSKGVLELNLTRAVKELQDTDLQKAKNKIVEKHYKQYMNFIYSTTRSGSLRGGVNKGHLAEAFEQHLSEHHKEAYGFLNTTEATSFTPFEKMASSQIGAGWHESASAAWLHIRQSMGTQRGTVAGDVNRFQVKSGSRENPKLRLARFNTIKEGILNYSAIIGDEDAMVVARRIAMYMSEPMRRTSQKLIDNIKDKTTQKVLEDINKTVQKGIIRI